MPSSEIKVQVLRQTLSTQRRHYLDWSHNFAWHDKALRDESEELGVMDFQVPLDLDPKGNLAGRFGQRLLCTPFGTWLHTDWLNFFLGAQNQKGWLACLLDKKKINIKSQKIKQLSKRTVEHNICIMPFVYHIAKTGSWNVQIASCSWVHPLQSVCTYFCTQSCKGRIAFYFFNIARKKGLSVLTYKTWLVSAIYGLNFSEVSLSSDCEICAKYWRNFEREIKKIPRNSFAFFALPVLFPHTSNICNFTRYYCQRRVLLSETLRLSAVT